MENKLVHIAGAFVTLGDIQSVSDPDEAGFVTVVGRVLDEDGDPADELSEFIVHQNRLVAEKITPMS